MGPRKAREGGAHGAGAEGIIPSECRNQSVMILMTALRIPIVNVLCAAILSIWLLLERGKLTTGAFKDWSPR
jgi:hypothetical protein